MKTIRIAVWSGPRNISTAMMRSWENRPDTKVIDEPFYAHYLEETGLQHPGRDAVLAKHETSWQAVINVLIGPCELPIYYQKHMAHHMLPMIDREWISHVKNVFLIRNPREMLTSLVHQIPNPTLKETGLPQQLTLFTELQQQGVSPIVIDSKNILQNPESSLSVLCKELGVPFLEQMLQWPAGKRDSDGVWAPHWYTSVESSTGFAPWSPKEECVPPTLESLCLECEDIYNELASHNMIV